MIRQIVAAIAVLALVRRVVAEFADEGVWVKASDHVAVISWGDGAERVCCITRFGVTRVVPTQPEPADAMPSHRLRNR